MLDGGVYRNQSELARGEGVSTAAVSIGLSKLHRGDGQSSSDDPAGSVAKQTRRARHAHRAPGVRVPPAPLGKENS